MRTNDADRKVADLIVVIVVLLFGLFFKLLRVLGDPKPIDL